MRWSSADCHHPITCKQNVSFFCEWVFFAKWKFFTFTKPWGKMNSIFGFSKLTPMSFNIIKGGDSCYAVAGIILNFNRLVSGRNSNWIAYICYQRESNKCRHIVQNLHTKDCQNYAFYTSPMYLLYRHDTICGQMFYYCRVMLLLTDIKNIFVSFLSCCVCILLEMFCNRYNISSDY